MAANSVSIVTLLSTVTISSVLFGLVSANKPALFRTAMEIHDKIREMREINQWFKEDMAKKLVM
ncbi:hypothetical protein Q7419_03950 [Glaesserella parasuis]|uniref:hypothetical protein n=1 Tax=Glaesserella parasuis TaxID=738 RepID=UPI002436E028|nr:hypothetical protein [Glaesserella parasuis]MDG6301172.1 hypothetical protein [Glaesserella parasuis]MDG6376576.1 hypothetical protein [Glaesserella parasuis]MDO9934795.1 hypothetical protein [Glaesserella parasuis]MDO9977301.1 hypothetical protein [Glaesserella parasuis]MDP0208846.1 hypothetical protein [Glaesserella parasuis]